MVSNFYPIDNSTGWGKNGMHLIFTPGKSCFYPKLLGKNGTSLKALTKTKDVSRA